MSEQKSMDIKKIKELIDLMKENDLVELEIVDDDFKVHLKRPGAEMPIMHAAPITPFAATAPAASAGTPSVPAAPAEEAGLLKITSPIVGTFYQASSPDSEPYVKVGSKVNTDTVVCVVEAMKVMNEIKAETAGTIVECCCKDGQAIEYGQVLFKVRP